MTLLLSVVMFHRQRLMHHVPRQMLSPAHLDSSTFCRHKSNNFESRQGWRLQAEAYSLLSNSPPCLDCEPPVRHPPLSGQRTCTTINGFLYSSGKLKARPRPLTFDIHFSNTQPCRKTQAHVIALCLLEKPSGWLWHIMSRAYRNLRDCCWCHVQIKRISVTTGARQFNILCEHAFFLKNIKTVNKCFLICIELNYIVL